ncbi:MAG: MmgE/PrpD family protein [Rhodospirillaceae bacterium]
MTTIARRLAEKIHDTRWEDLPAEAVHWAKVGILDTIACTLAGAPEPCTRIALKLPGVAAAPGPALAYGGPRTSILDAALINGIASHALDFDDVNNHIGGHPSVPLVPAIFAIADLGDGRGRGVSGRDVILAYIAGFEAETRIGRGVNHFHYEKGWHPTATLGIFGTTAASARLLGLDVDRTATALAIAVSLASGVKANFGTMTKPLHVGHSVRNGVFACLLARDGFTANDAAFEHHQGFLQVFNGKGNHDMEKGIAEWAKPWDVTQPGPNLKQYPCCGSTHGAINAMLELRRRHKIDPKAIEVIQVLTTPRRLPHTNNPDPKSGLEAKFSVHYCAARALLDGAVRLTHFEAGAENDKQARALMAVTTTGIHPDMSDPAHDGYGAEVTVRLKDGSAFSHLADGDVLRGPANPMTAAELYEKFSDCASRAMASADILPLYERLMTLDVVGDAKCVSDMIEGAAAVCAAE